MSSNEILVSMLLGALGANVSMFCIWLFNGTARKYFTERRARIEARKEAEHKRAMELATKRVELFAVAFSAAQGAINSATAYQRSKAAKFPAGGIVAPNPGTAEMVDNTEYAIATTGKRFPVEVNRKTPEEQMAARQAIRDAIKATPKAPPLGSLHYEGGKVFRVQYIDHKTGTFNAESYGEETVGIWRNFSQFKRITNNEQPTEPAP